MKAISASIIVLAAAIVFTQGAELGNDMDDASIVAGAIIGILGMIGWIGAFLEKSESRPD